jgi:hypothetical protein
MWLGKEWKAVGKKEIPEKNFLNYPKTISWNLILP